MQTDLKIIAIKIGRSNTTGKFKWKLGFFDNNGQRYLYRDQIQELLPNFYNEAKYCTKIGSVKMDDVLIDFIKYEGFLDIFKFEKGDILIINL